MNNFIFVLLLFVAADLLFQRCANPASPTGGPKDSIPPTLLSSYPENGTINFKESTFKFTFSEYINSDKLRQQLIITPKTDVKFKSIVKRNILTLKFEGPFQDSTTYNFNFANSIVDITEQNPVVNLSLAFSTGAYIDSMSIKGTAFDLFDQTPAENYTVGLYNLSDSLDYFIHQPLYFSTSNDSGGFQLDYIKADSYKLLVFEDVNKNILFDPDTEAHGFLADTIRLDSTIYLNTPVFTVLQNVKPITFINARPTGPYIEIKYNKTIHDYTILPDFFYSNIVGEFRDILRIYRPESVIYGDSINFIIHAKDSLENSTLDSIKTTFIESNRKPALFKHSISPSKAILQDDLTFSVNFNKPVLGIDSTKFSITSDSLLSYQLDPAFQWNNNRTKLTINSQIDKDSLISIIESLYPKDTSTITDAPIPGRNKPLNDPPVSFQIDEYAFTSIEGDSSQTQNADIQLTEPASFGAIRFTIATKETHFTVQLIDQSDKVKYQIKNELNPKFLKITPGSYNIRILIDDNKDGLWSAGNLLLNTEPESIYLYPEKTAVRENWDLEISLNF